MGGYSFRGPVWPVWVKGGLIPLKNENGPLVGLPLTIYSSTHPSTLTSTRVLVNTGSNLIQAAEVVQGGGGLAYINRV